MKNKMFINIFNKNINFLFKLTIVSVIFIIKMASYFDINTLISFLSNTYNENTKDVRSIIENNDFTTLIPLSLPNGIIICYDINTLDIVKSIMEYDEHINSVLLFNMTISCENLIKICNLVSEVSIYNLYFVKCTFTINTENGMTIDSYTEQIIDSCIINSICIEPENSKEGNGFDLLFNCMFKIIPYHIKFVEYNTLIDEEYQVFDRLLNFYNTKEYYIDLKMCNLIEDNFVQFLQTLKNNTTINSLSLSNMNSLHYIYFTPDYKNNKLLIQQLIDVLSKNTSITRLDLSEVLFNYKEGFGNTIAPLLENTTLTDLNLKSCNIGFYYNKAYRDNVPIYEETFYEALTKNTTLTSLSMTLYSYRVIQSIAEVLSKNSGLMKLDLDTRIKPIYNEFEEIMEPLKTNTTLTSLSLKRYTSKREWEEWEDCPNYYKLSYP